MFIHKGSNLIIPQREHARLAGNLALHWGNDQFDKPKIPLESVVKGITFHQNGFTTYDTLQVIGVDDKTLIEVFQRDFHESTGDPIADLINRFHQLRLLSKRVASVQSTEMRALKDTFENVIVEELKRSKYSKDEYLWADRITHLCDRISFNFSRNYTEPETVSLFGKNDSQVLINCTFGLNSSGTVVIDPIPFSVNEIRCVVIAYEREGYPEKLTPKLLEFKLASGIS